MESTAPTSWKCTSSTGMPWMRASASPITVKIRWARAFAPADIVPHPSIIARMSRSDVW